MPSGSSLDSDDPFSAEFEEEIEGDILSPGDTDDSFSIPDLVDRGSSLSLDSSPGQPAHPYSSSGHPVYPYSPTGQPAYPCSLNYNNHNTFWSTTMPGPPPQPPPKPSNAPVKRQTSLDPEEDWPPPPENLEAFAQEEGSIQEKESRSTSRSQLPTLWDAVLSNARETAAKRVTSEDDVWSIRGEHGSKLSVVNEVFDEPSEPGSTSTHVPPPPAKGRVVVPAKPRSMSQRASRVNYENVDIAPRRHSDIADTTLPPSQYENVAILEPQRPVLSCVSSDSRQEKSLTAETPVEVGTGAKTPKQTRYENVILPWEEVMSRHRNNLNGLDSSTLHPRLEPGLSVADSGYDTTTSETPSAITVTAEIHKDSHDDLDLSGTANEEDECSSETECKKPIESDEDDDDDDDDSYFSDSEFDDEDDEIEIGDTDSLSVSELSPDDGKVGAKVGTARWVNCWTSS